MGSSRPPPRTRDFFFPAPSLSLSLAGPFGGNEPAAAAAAAARGDGVENGDEGDGGIRGSLPPGAGVAAEISSENTGQGSQQSGGASSGAGAACREDAGDNKRRKSYHRHSAEQIRALESAFNESPHPDGKQRLKLSEQLGLSPRQVKFWFQNRRTQAKAMQERHENSLLRPELEKLQEENCAMRELIKKSSRCPSCGVAAAAANTEEQLLRLENAQLKAEIERLRGAPGSAAAAVSTSPARAIQNQIGGRNSLDDCVDASLVQGHEKRARMLDLAGRALDELTAMCSSGEPLWVRSVETGRDVLNYDEYVRLFRHADDESGDRRAVWPVEASRETGVVCLDMTQLVHAFVDANQWKEMFPSIISKAATLEVIRAGENDHLDGIVQLMFAEVQTLTPLVPTRELHFLRHCKKLDADKWAVVDVSFDNFEPDAQTTSTLSTCLKKPSGCIVEEQSSGRCKVTWVEHAKCRKAAAPSAYRAVTASGLAFGARRWVGALRLQCERRVFLVATNVPTRGSNGVATLSGRRSVLNLAHRMTSSLCRAIGGSRGLTWRKASNHGGGTGSRGIRVTSRRNASEPGEPQGLIACAVLSAWLPVTPAALFDFLRDESRRHEWDAMLPAGQSVQRCVTVPKGKDRGNCVTAYAAESPAAELSGKWILQDSSTGSCESTVAYAAVDTADLRAAIDGCDSSGVAVLPCGFAVMPDGLEAKPSVITSRKEEDRAAAEGTGSIVTVAFQALVASSPATDDALPSDAVEGVTGLVSSTLGNIKKAMGCEDR